MRLLKALATNVAYVVINIYNVASRFLYHCWNDTIGTDDGTLYFIDIQR